MNRSTPAAPGGLGQTRMAETGADRRGGFGDNPAPSRIRSATHAEASLLQRAPCAARQRLTVFERYYRELLNFLALKVYDRGVAAELTQESYARVYAAQATGLRVGDPRALLYRTARNLLVDQQRYRELRSTVELAPGTAEADQASGPRGWEPEAALASRQGLEAMIDAIDGLPPRCREAFMLNRFEDLSYAEVGARMGISVKAVEQHIKLALDTCERRRLASGGDAAAPGPRRKLPRSRQS